ncbi:hypothetical protein FRB99_000071 [Tulasnella sp. 403]|nr:hypothetical protein FRB99_000071 [Tulasnella sp. 403]
MDTTISPFNYDRESFAFGSAEPNPYFSLHLTPRPTPQNSDEEHSTGLLADDSHVSYACMQNPVTRPSHCSDSNHCSLSPPRPWNDTPQTLYKMSPETEVGDMDVVLDSDDEETNPSFSFTKLAFPPRSFALSADGRNIRDKDDAQRPVVMPSSTPNPYSPNTFNPSHHGVDHDDCEDLRPDNFARLRHDIRSVALFPWTPPTLNSTPLPEPLVSSTSDGTPSVTSNDRYTPTLPIRHSDHLQTAHFRTTPKRSTSMHLRNPQRPINPYHRPSQRPASPIRPYPAPAINRSHLRRFYSDRPPEVTVTMKELIMPNAQFYCGFDPEVMATELIALPSEPLEDVASRHSSDASPNSTIMDTESYESHAEHPIANSGSAFAVCTPVVEPQTTTPEPELSNISSDEEDEPQAYDDDDYKAPGSSRWYTEHSAKRVKAFATLKARDYDTLSSANTTTRPPPIRRAPHTPPTRQRQRHLQPNLVRNNGCMHGCPLLFSTPYEARRHQEDAHGREEAYRLVGIAASSENFDIYPRDYRFLIHVGLHAADKWDSRTKAAFTSAQNEEDVPLTLALADSLVKFATEWTKRYECPRCGTSFSRLDSKKRHFEKQCR